MCFCVELTRVTPDELLIRRPAPNRPATTTETCLSHEILKMIQKWLEVRDLCNDYY